jgi:Mycobacterium membrane protein
MTWGDEMIRRVTGGLAVVTGVVSALPILLAAPAMASSSVTYSVDSDGSLSLVSYFNEFNIQAHVTDVSSPWRTSFDTNISSQILIVEATTTGQHVSCSITVDGVVRDHQSADGPSAKTHCGHVAGH